MKQQFLLSGFLLLLAINTFGQNGQDGNVSWSIVDNTLTLSGTGEMKDYNYNENIAPWYPYSSQVDKIVINEGLTTIGNSAFALCSGIESIEIPNTIISIGNNSFLGCRNLMEIDIPNSIETIGALAFGACGSLININIPRRVSAIGEGAFSGCSKLKSIKVDINNNVYKDIDGIVFSKDNKELLIYPAGKEEVSYTVPDYVSAIGYGAFLNCGNLKKIEISDGVTTIGMEAFYNCQNLRIITIPGSVTVIGDNAFMYCRNLDTVEVYWDKPVPVNTNIFIASSIVETTLVVPSGTKNNYETANVWKEFGSIIERSPTANLYLNEEKVNAIFTNGKLVVDSPYSETIRAYNTAGSLVFSTEKKEGKITYPFSNQQGGIYIVTGSSGWSVKVLKK